MTPLMQWRKNTQWYSVNTKNKTKQQAHVGYSIQNCPDFKMHLSVWHRLEERKLLYWGQITGSCFHHYKNNTQCCAFQSKKLFSSPKYKDSNTVNVGHSLSFTLNTSIPLISVAVIACSLFTSFLFFYFIFKKITAAPRAHLKLF